MDIQLKCFGYNVNLAATRCTEVTTDFRLQHYIATEEIDEVLHRVVMYLRNRPINTVKATDKPRCFYLGE